MVERNGAMLRNWGTDEVVRSTCDGGRTPGFVCERVGEDGSGWTCGLEGWKERCMWVVGSD